MKELNKYKIIAYSILVRSSKYILSEDDREYDYQLLVPNDYIIAVSEKLIK